MTIKTELLYLLETGVNQGKFDKVNNGGCGIFAAAMHNTLAAYGIESQIVLVDSGYDEVAVSGMINNMDAYNIDHAFTLMMNEEDGQDNDPCCGHICLRVDGELYDGDGVYHGESISGPIHVNVMSRMNRKSEYWNYTFESSNSGHNGYVDDDGNAVLISIIRDVNKHVKCVIETVM